MVSINFCQHLKNISLRYQSTNYFTQSIGNISTIFHYFIGYVDSSVLALKSIQIFYLYGIFLIVNTVTLTSDLIFTTQRQTIFSTYARRHEKNDLCFDTQEGILVEDIQKN